MEHTRIVKAYGAKVCIQSWDRLVPIGTPCTVHGVATKTWSHAGYGPKGVPAAFVEAFEEPVPLTAIKIKGVEMVPQRQKQARG